MTGTANEQRTLTDRVVKRLVPVLAILVLLSKMTGFTTKPWLVLFWISLVAWLVDMYRTRDTRA